MSEGRGGFSFIQANTVSNQEQVAKGTLQNSKELRALCLYLNYTYLVVSVYIFYILTLLYGR